MPRQPDILTKAPMGGHHSKHITPGQPGPAAVPSEYQDREPIRVSENAIQSFVEQASGFNYEEGKEFDGLFAAVERRLGNPALTGFVKVIPSDPACRFTWALFGTDHKEFWHSGKSLKRAVAIVLAHGEFQLTGYSIKNPDFAVWKEWVVQGRRDVPEDGQNLATLKTGWETIDEVFEDGEVLSEKGQVRHWNCVAREPYRAFRIANIGADANYMGIWQLEFFGKFSP